MEFELILWGATGYTGQLVASYLAAHAPADLRWAIAGRDASKLARVRDALPPQRDIPFIIADSHDEASLRAMVARTRLVISTVGPYALHGTPLVAACAELGRDYVDLTGEPQWIRRNVQAFHATAVASRARVVHCCGFDCIPADLGLWLLHQTLAAPLRTAHLRVRRMRGGVSGGTLASMLQLMDERGRDPAAAAWANNSNALLPDAAVTPMPPRRVAYDATLASWTAPFVMDAIDVPVVHRTNALLGHAYGTAFAYDEAMCAPSRLKAELIAAGMKTALAATALSPLRAVLRRIATPPGQGPSTAARRAGRYEIVIHGEAMDGRRAQVVVADDRDPGYGGTSVMLAEAALCLLRDVPRAQERPNAHPGGIRTPASTMAAPLIERLRRTGMRFSTEPLASI
ncbi:MAG: saccharopine dehydrogenase NADP-binding domain-containing protein [Myxococcales bacterium]|nr:saccharopine dehydrogenase NADP-binding domain-containing protein [Myxococcales bacterium]